MVQEVRAMNTRMEDFSAGERRHAELCEEMEMLERKGHKGELQVRHGGGGRLAA